MIKEIANFTATLDEKLKNLGVKPVEGVHVLLSIVEKDNTYQIDTENIYYERFTAKLPETEFLEKCKFYKENAWCIDTNKCFDLPSKAIHSCSPFCVAFKREHFEGGAKYLKNAQEQKKQVNERIGDYFEKALALLDSKERGKYQVFKSFFATKEFAEVLRKIFAELSEKENTINAELTQLKNQLDTATDKLTKESLKLKIKDLENEKEKYKALDESEYIIFYLNEPLEKYKSAHQKYLADKLFNTNDYNTSPDTEGNIYGTSNFFNSYNVKMPFLKHKTATFEISGRISDKEARLLYEFEQILKRKILPNPLPIFIYKDELQKKVISIFNESGNKASYREIIEKLYQEHYEDLSDYYLLSYALTKDGLVFRDFDFVTKFEYELKDSDGKNWNILDLFGVGYDPTIENVFEFQNQILQIIFNNNLIVKTKDGSWLYKYFDDIDETYCKSARNYLLIIKYRKAFYDFIYKSQRKAVSREIFHEIMQTSILEDIRLDEFKNGNHSEYFNIRKKLNIWFSLYEKFDLNPNSHTPMASKLNDYREFVEKLAQDKADFSQASLEHFAFAAGQVIYYILQKSKSADASYQRLEPYLQQATCEGLKKAIANDFARYKHENYSNRFERVAAFVLTYQSNENMKKVLPELLAGVFSNNLLFAEKSENQAVQNANI
ncbi:MAG: hypothetical protein NZ519_05005 [Bacteroidia bacterium]|nr:hypothetical protein [Bacteroidia bacterium]